MVERTHHPRVVLVTGGAGFIGANFVRYLLQADQQVRVINLDALTYAGSLSNLTGLAETYGDRYQFVQGNICDAPFVRGLFREESIDTVVHLAAESHVDRSINAPGEFIMTNVVGTYTLLEAAREAWADRTDVRFHHVSTDEVYGSLGDGGLFTETTAYDPSSPYSASKAGSDHLVRAWGRTYGLNVTVSNCSNNYGPYQFPEKLVPLMICNCLQENPLPVYGDGGNIRQWLYVGDHCRALDLILRSGRAGRTYNLGGHSEWKNIDLVHLLCDTMQELRPRPQGHYRELIIFVPDRPGHDRRYAVDSSRLQSELNWQAEHDFRSGLRATLRWYLENQQWVEQILAERYDGSRLGLLEKQ